MTILYNRRDLKGRRRRLRANMTDPEVILWSRLKNSQLLGAKFRRQHSVGPYILDFYCPEVHVAVEVDGESHFTPAGQSHDAQRTQFLEAIPIRVVRVTNREIMTNLDGVLALIASALTEQRPGDQK